MSAADCGRLGEDETVAGEKVLKMLQNRGVLYVIVILAVSCRLGCCWASLFDMVGDGL